MNKLLIGFTAGMFLTGGLFQFDIDLPRYKSQATKKLQSKNKQLQSKNKQLQSKQSKLKTAVNTKRNRLSATTGKKIAKRTAAAAIPVIGTVFIVGLGAEEYCADLEESISLSNIVNDNDEKFNYDKCYIDAKESAGGLWDATKIVVGNWVQEIDLIPDFQFWAEEDTND